ncbi:uncharacterized protein METZ01_LOCUS1341 [marine metagenome]|uniref:Uncharacterized protein n=1 Tax=marine metagenome TaxID=408172 RepID=A0A381N1S7_9ZZZZ
MNWPVVTILMHGHFHAIRGWFAEHLTAPKNDVGSNQLFYPIEYLWALGELQPRPVTSYALIIEAIDMSTDQMFRSY